MATCRSPPSPNVGESSRESHSACSKFVSGPLKEDQLFRLLQHKYNVKGQSVLEPVMQLMWNRLLHFLPMWAAPNALTLTGLVLNISSTAALACYSPDAKSELPAAVCFYAAAALLIYQTLDALDGKQARRTGSSSALGELFDHGCDAVNTLLVSIGCCIAVGMGQYPHLLMIECIGSVTVFYIAHWMCYITGEIRFGFIDVTELQLSVIIIYLLTGVFGVKNMWSCTIPLLNIELKQMQFVIVIMSGCFIMIRLLVCIIRGGIGRNGSTVANTSIGFPGLFAILPPLLTATVAMASPGREIYLSMPCLYIYTFGLLGVKACQLIIVAHMTKSGLNLFDSALLSPAALAVNQFFNCALPVHLALPAAAVFATCDLVLYSIRLCRQIAAYLGIRVLHIQ